MLIGDIFDAWKVGKQVADPEKWKKRGVTAGLLATLILALQHIACSFGYCLDIDEGTIRAVADGLAAGLCLFVTGVHVTTTTKIGLPPKRDDTDGAAAYANGVGADPEAIKRFLDAGGHRSPDQV